MAMLQTNSQTIASQTTSVNNNKQDSSIVFIKERRNISMIYLSDADW